MDAIKPFDTSIVKRVASTKTDTPATKDPVKASEQFEGMLVKQLLDSMWQTVPQGQLLSGSNEEGLYRDMLNDAVATSISEGRGIGIKDVILRDINKLSKNK